MFTIPVGNFAQNTVASIVRPTSSVDTVGSGSITNSNFAYDISNTTYGTWVSKQQSYPSDNYSIFSFTSSATTDGNILYCKMGSVAGNPFNSIAVMLVSFDGGATYPFGNSNNFYTDPVTPIIFSQPIPFGTTISDIKVKVFTANIAPYALDTTILVYDIYIST